jgi:hypothetical protein
MTFNTKLKNKNIYVTSKQDLEVNIQTVDLRWSIESSISSSYSTSFKFKLEDTEFILGVSLLDKNFEVTSTKEITLTVINTTFEMNSLDITDTFAPYSMEFELLGELSDSMDCNLIVNISNV